MRKISRDGVRWSVIACDVSLLRNICVNINDKGNFKR